MTLKEEGCSKCHTSVKIGCSKPVAHAAVNYFTKLRIYWDEERKGHPRKTSTGDESMMKLNVKISPSSSHKKSVRSKKKG